MKYIQCHLNLKESQKAKLTHARKYNEPVTLEFEKNQMISGGGGDLLHLTQTQINKLNKAENC